MKSEAIVIRPYEVTDAPVVWEKIRTSFDALHPWAPWCHANYSIEETRTWLEAQVNARGARTAFEFAIESSDGQYLGGCGLNQIDAVNQRANLGYWVHSGATGQGVATAAVQHLHQWAKDNTTLVRLELVIATGNLASQRVAAKAGAKREGVLSKRLLLHGTAHDAVMFSLTR